MKEWTLPGVLLMAAAVPGCGTLVPQPDPVQTIRSEWTGVPKEAIASAPARWWEQFHSTQLNALVEEALRGNPGLGAANQRLQAARILQGAGRAAFRPGVALQTGSESTPEATRSYFQSGLTARWELPLFERGRNNARILQSQSAVALADLAASRGELVAETVRTYLQGRFAADQVVVADELVQVTATRRERMAARVSFGLDDGQANHETRQQWNDAQLHAQELRQTRAQSLETLAALLGESHAQEGWIDPASPAPELPAPPVSTPADLLRNRPDIRIAEAAMERAAAELGIARAEFYPHIGFEGALTAALPLAGGGSSGLQGILSVGPVISLPLFDWGLRRAQSEARGAGLHAAALAYRQVVLNAVAEAELAYRGVGTAMNRVAMLSDVVADAAQTAQRASMRRELGLQDQVPALDATRHWLQARRELDDARLDQALALVHLHVVLGSGGAAAGEAPDQW